MKQKFLLILVIFFVTIIFLSSCTSKDQTTSPTTQEQKTETSTQQKSIFQCGNNNCEPEESKCTCPADCGECSGSAGTCLEHQCSEIECSTQFIPNCCGNKRCEEPENYELCPTDCTADSMIDKINISENDLPLITGNGPWSRDRYDSVGETQVDSSIRGLGLIRGRNIGFTSDKASINQQILIYPVENINKILDATNKNEILRWGGSPEDMYELPSPNIGDKSRAFKLLLNNEPYMYYLAFTKKGYYELIEIRGHSGYVPEYKLLEDIARKAASKIN